MPDVRPATSMSSSGDHSRIRGPGSQRLTAQNPDAAAMRSAGLNSSATRPCGYPEGPHDILPSLDRAVRSSNMIQVASGILSVDTVAVAAVRHSAAWRASIQAAIARTRGRRTEDRPLATLNGYS